MDPRSGSLLPINNIFELAAVFWRRKLLWLCLIIAGTACGISLGKFLSQRRFSVIALEFVPQSLDVIQKANDMNASLATMFTRPEIAKDYSKRFFAELDRLAASPNRYQEPAKRALEKWIEIYGGDRGRAGAEDEFAAYLSGDMVFQIRSMPRISYDTFHYVVYSPFDSQISIFLVAKETGLARVVGAASGAALSPSIRAFNEANTKAWRAFLSQRAGIFRQVLASPGSGPGDESSTSRTARLKVWKDLDLLERFVTEKEGVAKKSPPTVRPDEAMRVEDLVQRLAQLRDKKVISELEYDEKLTSLSEVREAESALASGTKAAEGLAFLMQDFQKNQDFRDRFLLADVRFSETLLASDRSLGKMDQRTFSVRKWGIGSVFVSLVFATAVVFLIEFGKSFIARMQSMTAA